MKKFQIGEEVTGRVTAILPAENNANKAGYLQVSFDESIGIVPISEISPEISEENNARHVARRYMGRMVISKVKGKEPLLLSIKDAVRERLLGTKVDVGQEIKGTVVWVSRKQAEIEYNNCLVVILPSSEYGHLRIGDLTEVIKPGQEITVEVKEIIEDKIIVSHKKFASNPWPAIQAKYRLRGQYLGRVVKVIEAGVFVNLEPGLDVLAAPYPNFFDVYPGDEVALEITDMEPSTGKIKGTITTRVSVAESKAKII